MENWQLSKTEKENKRGAAFLGADASEAVLEVGGVTVSTRLDDCIQ
jgi:hypothetical protein